MRRLPFVLALFAALLLPSGAAGTLPRARSLQAGGPIKALAMDGSRVAYDVGNATMSHGTGNKVVVWNVLTGKSVKVSGTRTSQADITSTGRGVAGLAVAGTRVAWTINQGGNSESDDYLCTSTVASPRERTLATALRTGDVDGVLAGNWIGTPVGAGSFLAVNRWTTVTAGAIAGAGLDAIGNTSLRRIASGAGTLYAQATDGVRVAALRSDGTIAIFSTSGKLLKTIAAPGTQRLALHGIYVVALTKTRKLDVYDSRTGRLLHEWTARGPRTAGPQNLDVEANTAIYTAGRELHVLQVRSGKDRVLATYANGIKLAQIEPAGVVYAGNARHGTKTLGALYFVPWKGVAAAIS
jgi:hypothetical protein